MRHTITAALLCVCLTVAAGCKKASEPAAQPQAVQQTISMEQPAPTDKPAVPAAGTETAAPQAVSPESAEKPATMTAEEKGKVTPEPAPAAGTESDAAAPGEQAAALEAVEAPGEAAAEAVGEMEPPIDGEMPAEPEVVLDLMDIEANALGTDGVDSAKEDEEVLFSPFTPLFQKDEKNEMVVESDSQQQRAFLTPLERISLGQLQLSGIIRATSGNRAIVTDATGKGYVIKKGTYVGLNSGRVEEIVDDRVVVIEMIGGRKSVTELKLQKPAGE